MLFDKEDERRVQEFIAELRSMHLSVEEMVEDYDRLIALYDISFFFRIYLRNCAQALHDRIFDESQSALRAGRYMQFFETELTTMPRMIFLFQSAYGSRFVRSVYQASYLAFIERQQQATNFLKKCVAEHDKFAFFRKTIATIEDNHLIEEPKVLNPRLKGRPHNRSLKEASVAANLEEAENFGEDNRLDKEAMDKEPNKRRNLHKHQNKQAHSPYIMKRLDIPYLDIPLDNALEQGRQGAKGLNEDNLSDDDFLHDNSAFKL